MKQLITSIFLLFTLAITSHAQVLYGTTYEGGTRGGGVINTYEPSIQTYNVAKNFSIDGEDPYGNLTRASDGKLYGLAPYGGIYDNGTLFSYDPASGNYTTLHNFDYYHDGGDPEGSLFLASDGKFYGTTSEGGANEYGTIFSYDPATNTIATLYNFNNNDGSYPYQNNLTQASNGKLYGMTYEGGTYNFGVIFSFDPVNNAYNKLYDFDGTKGYYPYGNLVQATDGNLYGVAPYGGTNGYGVIFSFNITTNNFNKLYDFDNDNGANPYGSLMQASDGKLYGMAENGGSNEYGVIFSYDPAGSGYNVVYNFDDTNGKYPAGNNLIQAADGKLYGMVNEGGVDNAGVIFSYDLAGSGYDKLYDFDYNTGEYPYGDLLQTPDGNLYGLTYDGGTADDGVLFSYNIASSSFDLIRSFYTNYEGANPGTGLYKASDGKLYGTTNELGTYDWGTLFSYNPANDSLVKLVDFNGDNGGDGGGHPIQASDGKLYGTTQYGGTSGRYSYGVLYSYDLTNSAYTVLYNFDGTAGQFPIGSLVQATDGKLYGTGYSGGANGAGVIFSYDPTTNTYIDLYDFDGSNGNGANPLGSLILASDGKLYGITNYGGANGAGVIFSYDPSGSGFNKVYDFDITNGNNPSGELMQASDGKLYGTTTYGGLSGNGVIFSYDPAGSGFQNLYNFDGTNGSNPYSGLAQAPDGKLYGMTYQGGTADSGVVYSYDPLAASDNFLKIKDLNFNSGGYSFYSSFITLPCNTPKTFYKDVDGDGYGDPNNTIAISCTPPAGYVKNNGDCDDSNATVHPGAKELCDGIDNNCDGQIDEGCPIPKFRIYDASIYEGNSGEKKLQFRVALSDTAYRTVMVNYKTVNNTAKAPEDYVAANGTLTFHKGEKRQFITVNIKGDTKVEPDETFKVKLLSPVNATLKDGVAIGTILNDDGSSTIAGTGDRMLSINTQAGDKALVVAPNPATSAVTIRLSGYSGNTVIQVSSVEGRLLKIIKTEGTTVQQLNVSDLAAGTYFLSATDEEGYKQTVKLVVTH